MALHVLAMLAYREGENLSSSRLAASVNTNPVIIRRLLLALQAAKLVESRKGRGLGSRLCRSAARINLAEVYRAVEGSAAFVQPRRKPNPACPVGRGIAAAVERVFRAAQRSLERDLAGWSLADVLASVDSSARTPRKKMI